MLPVSPVPHSGTVAGVMLSPLLSLKYLCVAVGCLAATHLEFSLGHHVMCKRENKEVVRGLENTKQRRKKKHPYPQMTTTAAKLKKNI